MAKGFNINSDELTAHRAANPLKGGELPPAVRAVIMEYKRQVRHNKEQERRGELTDLRYHLGWRTAAADMIRDIEKAATGDGGKQ